MTPHQTLFRVIGAVAFVAALLALPGCGDDAPAPDAVPAADGADDAGVPWFQEEAAARGLVFQQRSGHAGRFLYPEIMCGGAALFDMEQDGDLDAFLVQAGGVVTPSAERPPDQLFENDGSGRFIDVTNTVMPPAYVQTIGNLIDDPGWVTFTLKGDFAYPSTGDIIDPKTKKIVARLKDEQGRDVQSEKVIEIQWAGGSPVRNGDQFGVGRNSHR